LSGGGKKLGGAEKMSLIKEWGKAGRKDKYVDLEVAKRFFTMPPRKMG